MVPNTVPQIYQFRRYSRASISTAFQSDGFDSSAVMLRRRPATVATNDLRSAAPTAADSEAFTASVLVGKCCACTHACSLRNAHSVCSRSTRPHKMTLGCTESYGRPRQGHGGGHEAPAFNYTAHKS